jgi:LDH2 family malate/lactate/ureidoglycolate dehydrogenase
VGDAERQTFKVAKGSALAAAQDMVCSGFIPVATSAESSNQKKSAPPSVGKIIKDIEAAKIICSELGFLEKSEKFAECALKVSK